MKNKYCIFNSRVYKLAGTKSNESKSLNEKVKQRNQCI